MTLSLPDLVRELDAFQPGILGGYATVLTLLAHEQEAGRLHIRPALVISGAETLPRAMRAMMERAFACPVRETYLSSEAELAFDCGQGSFHVNDDWVVLEPVDETYKPTPPGRPSHSVLVTNLANRVQPLLRYDLGDSVSVKSEPCPCGSPLTAISIEGRTDHILDFAGPDGTRIRLPPLALTTIVHDTPGVHRYQVIQTAPDRLSIRLQATRPEEDGVVWAAVRDRLTTYLTQQGLIGVTVDRRPEPPAPDPRGGKFHHVWSELQPRTRQG